MSLVFQMAKLSVSSPGDASPNEMAILQRFFSECEGVRNQDERLDFCVEEADQEGKSPEPSLPTHHTDLQILRACQSRGFSRRLNDAII